MSEAASTKLPLQPGNASVRSAKPRTLQEAVALALDKRSGSRWPVSVADTVNAVRTVMPDCDLTDDELADLVAIASLERGLSITFDRDLLQADEREAAFA